MAAAPPKSHLTKRVGKYLMGRTIGEVRGGWQGAKAEGSGCAGLPSAASSTRFLTGAALHTLSLLCCAAGLVCQSQVRSARGERGGGGGQGAGAGVQGLAAPELLGPGCVPPLLLGPSAPAAQRLAGWLFN